MKHINVESKATSPTKNMACLDFSISKEVLRQEGMQTFSVNEVISSRFKRNIPRLLGISKSGICLMNQKTEDTIKIWSKAQVSEYKYSGSAFILKCYKGRNSNQSSQEVVECSLQTSEGEKINKLLQNLGYNKEPLEIVLNEAISPNKKTTDVEKNNTNTVTNKSSPTMNMVDPNISFLKDFLNGEGPRLFSVKEGITNGPKNLVPSLLGISRKGIYILNEKTKDIIKIWYKEQICDYNFNASTFTLECIEESNSDHSSKENVKHVMQTLEGEKIYNIMNEYNEELVISRSINPISAKKRKTFIDKSNIRIVPEKALKVEKIEILKTEGMSLFSVKEGKANQPRKLVPRILGISRKGVNLFDQDISNTIFSCNSAQICDYTYTSSTFILECFETSNSDQSSKKVVKHIIRTSEGEKIHSILKEYENESVIPRPKRKKNLKERENHIGKDNIIPEKALQVEKIEMLKTEGMRIFSVKEGKANQPKKLVPRILGISRKGVKLFDQDINKTIFSFNIDQICDYTYTSSTFILECSEKDKSGDSSKNNKYIMQTSEGEQISSLLKDYSEKPMKQILDEGTRFKKQRKKGSVSITETEKSDGRVVSEEDSLKEKTASENINLFRDLVNADNMKIFLVKERKGKQLKKLIPRLLGISLKGIYILDQMTFSIVHNWNREQVFNYKYTELTFSLEYTEELQKDENSKKLEYKVETTEGKDINKMVKEFIEQIPKSKTTVLNYTPNSKATSTFIVNENISFFKNPKRKLEISEQGVWCNDYKIGNTLKHWTINQICNHGYTENTFYIEYDEGNNFEDTDERVFTVKTNDGEKINCLLMEHIKLFKKKKAEEKDKNESKQVEINNPRLWNLNFQNVRMFPMMSYALSNFCWMLNTANNLSSFIEQNL